MLYYDYCIISFNVLKYEFYIFLLYLSLNFYCDFWINL